MDFENEHQPEGEQNDEGRSSLRVTPFGLIDPHLANLVARANAGEIRPSITLNVAGTIVSGKLISYENYCDIFAEELESLGTLDDSPYPKIAQDYRESGSRKESQKGVDNASPPSFIHLNEAKIYAPGSNRSMPTDTGILWRGKLISVDGYFFGRLMVVPTQDETDGD